MKTQRYIIDIEMPDGDYVSASLIESELRDIVNSEDCDRCTVKVSGVCGTSLSADMSERLKYLGILPDGSDVRSHNIGTSDYNSGKHTITPWSIWLDYPELTPFDHDIIKRVLRTKSDAGYSSVGQRTLDYEKIIHVCQERIRQLKYTLKD